MKKIIVFFIISIIFITNQINLFALTREKELYNEAVELRVNGKYKESAKILNKIITDNPDIKDDNVYYMLWEVYDKELYDYEKAIDLMKKYIKKFPSGTLYGTFEERLEILENEKWQLIKEFEIFKKTYYDRTETENIIMLNQMLEKYPNSIFANEIHLMLANDYYNNGELNKALTYIEKFISGTSEELSENDETSAYLLYSDILMWMHKYDKASKVLENTLNDNPSRIIQYEEKLFEIKEEQITWYGFITSCLYVLFFIMILIKYRVWQYSSNLIDMNSIAKWVSMIVGFTIVPLVSIIYIGKGYFNVFFAFMVSSMIVFSLIYLFASASEKIGRVKFITLSIFLALAGVYIPYYLTDFLFIFWSDSNA